MKPDIGRLHVITDESLQRRFTHAKLAGFAASGGAGAIQFRDKRMGTRELIETATALKRISRIAGIPLIINDRVDIAMVVDADGVHLGQQDIPIQVARDLLGPEKIIGGTAGTLEEALDVERDGADYVGVGHVYPTHSKKKPSRPIGPQALAHICSSVHIPVIGIGGIDTSNVAPVIRAGAFGVAVISAICEKSDPEAAVTELQAAIESTLAEINDENIEMKRGDPR